MRGFIVSDLDEIIGNFAPLEYTHMFIHNFSTKPGDPPNAIIAKRAKDKRFLPIHQVKGIKEEVLYQRIWKVYCFDHLGHRVERKHLLYDIFYFRIVPKKELITRLGKFGEVLYCLNGINWYRCSPDDFILQIGYIGVDDVFRSTLIRGEEAKESYLRLTGCKDM